MDKKAIGILEYNIIKTILKSQTVTEKGKQIVERMHPQTDINSIKNLLYDTQDGVDIINYKGLIPIQEINNIDYIFDRLKIGAILNGSELLEVYKMLCSVRELKKFFKNLSQSKLSLINLYNLADGLVQFPNIYKKLKETIDNDGNIMDNASQNLKYIRLQIRNIDRDIHSNLNHILHGENATYLSDSLITVRNNRYVIPVRSSEKYRFHGIIHDQSASGQTTFIEPQIVINLNNKIKNLKNMERREIHEILKNLSLLLANHISEFYSDSNIIGHLDFINAKSIYAKKISGTMPVLSRNNEVVLHKVWHPLLKSKLIVKNDISFGKDHNIIVITGPNTGGKTITLKTVGIVQLMGQSGLFIPAKEGSRIGVFDSIYADIGDEQSIEQNLSTFSGHMKNIVYILKNATNKSLILLDELGSGTDPQEGSTLAISILNDLALKGSCVIATTHYPDLKIYAYEHNNWVNASMEFNSNTLKPTYRLLIGIPGRSNAFDISKRLGLSDKIIKDAKSILNKDNKNLNDIISDLVKKRRNARENKILFEKYLHMAENLYTELKNKFDDLENQKDVILNDAKIKANNIVEHAIEKSNLIVNDLHRLKLNGSEKRVKENQIIDKKTELNSLIQKVNLGNNRILNKVKNNKKFHINDDVIVRPYSQRGTLVNKIDDKFWKVQIGSLKLKVDVSNLEKISKKNDDSYYSNKFSIKRSKSTGLSTTLDVRGQTVEDALKNVDNYIDSAILAGYSSVTIIHGKGTGALKHSIKKYLSNSKYVRKLNYSAPEAGGDGAIIVYLK